MKRKEGWGGTEQGMMTVKEAAEYLRYSEQTIQKYVMKRKIPLHLQVR